MEIVINPKMSFGTGHHETTFLMTQALFEIDLQGKSVLDAGTGTGILALVATKLGAQEVKGFDIDPWSIENSIENAGLNQCEDIIFVEGTIINESLKKYDVLLANINRNILLAEMHEYSERIVDGGLLLLSGFYAEDVPLILKSATENGLAFITQTEKNHWTCIKLIKI
jgi:ribosomal protein L11 methyltransferase